MAAAARVLPLRPLRALRSPRRHPTTLRSVPTREASGAPAPAAPPPSSAPPAGAPPATPPGAGAPPAAPPASPLPESGERVREEAPGLALSDAHGCLIFQLASAMSELDEAMARVRQVQKRAREVDPKGLALLSLPANESAVHLENLSQLLRLMSEVVTGLPEHYALATHAVRLGQLDGYAQGWGVKEVREDHLQEALDSFHSRSRPR